MSPFRSFTASVLIRPCDIIRPPSTPSSQSSWSAVSIPNREFDVHQALEWFEQLPFNDDETTAAFEDDSDWDDPLCSSEIDRLSTDYDSEEEYDYQPGPTQNRCGSPDQGSLWVFGCDGIRRVPVDAPHYPNTSSPETHVHPEYTQFFDMDLIITTLDAHLPPFRASQRMQDASNDEWRCVCGCDADHCFFRPIMWLLVEHVQQRSYCEDSYRLIPTCPVGELIAYFKTHLYDEFDGAVLPFLDHEAYSKSERYDSAVFASCLAQAHPVPTCALIQRIDAHTTCIPYDASKIYHMITERNCNPSNLDPDDIAYHSSTYHQLAKVIYHPLFFQPSHRVDVYSSDDDSEDEATTDGCEYEAVDDNNGAVYDSV